MLANLLLFTLLALLAKCEIIYPNLTLPWGTWQATDYDENVDVRLHYLQRPYALSKGC